MPRGYNLYDEMVLQGQVPTEAQQYISAVERVDNAALESNAKVAISNFVVGCMTDGIWNAIKVSCILAGARTLDGALVPLTGPAPSNFNFVTADYNRATGLKGNGTSNYLNTNRLNSDQPQNSSHQAVFFTQFQSRDSTRCAIGSGGSLGASQILLAQGPTPRIYFRINYGLGSAHHPSTANDDGLLAANRADSSGITGRIGGVNYLVADNSIPPVAQNVLVFARNPSTPINFSDGRISFYSIGESIDLALLDRRVSELMTAYSTAF